MPAAPATLITETEARRLALLWRDPCEVVGDPDPLAEFGRIGVVDLDGVLEALAGIESVASNDAAAMREVGALLDYFAEAKAPEAMARAQGMADGEAGVPSRFAEFAPDAGRSDYIRGYADAKRAGWTS